MNEQLAILIRDLTVFLLHIQNTDDIPEKTAAVAEELEERLEPHLVEALRTMKVVG